MTSVISMKMATKNAPLKEEVTVKMMAYRKRVRRERNERMSTRQVWLPLDRGRKKKGVLGRSITLQRPCKNSSTVLVGCWSTR